MTHHSSLITHHSARAFTLIELMVVVAIIALLLTMTVPAIGPMITSNQMAQTISTLNGLMVMAQSHAEVNATAVAVRIEQAFETTTGTFGSNQQYTVMATTVDRNGRTVPKWLPYQQARMLLFARPRQNAAGGASMADTPERMNAFGEETGAQVVPLAKNIWVAPLSSIENRPSPPPWPPPPPPHPPNFGALTDTYTTLLYQPPTPSGASTPPTPYNRLNTFYVVFRPSGSLVQLQSPYGYQDQTQPFADTGGNAVAPVIDHPDDSQRGLLLYDRQAFESLPGSSPLVQDANRWLFLQEQGKPVFLNRFLGSIVEGRAQ